MKAHIFIFVSFVLLTTVLAASPDQWRSRVIYQLLTDRFAKTTDDFLPCQNLQSYCGGTFQGIMNHLDYIQGMGFDAIWISPIITNTPNGYHGYWAQDIYTINSYFGSEQDLINLVDACHQRGIWVMLDVVGNHMGPTAIQNIYPFNQTSHYHDCSSCPQNCQISDYTCFQSEVQLCQLAGLPDLNQTVPFVQNTLQSWVKGLVQTYGFDGLRIDTCPEVVPSFWPGFVNAAGTYAVGEVFSDINCCIQYQQQALPGVLSYPMFFTLRSSFAQQQSLNNVQGQFFAYKSFADTGLLGTFIDNHDNPRFLNEKNDYQLYKNALVYTLMSEGIPIIYYGSEQGFSGGNDPNNREPLWTSKYDTSAELYQFIAQVVNFYKSANIFNTTQVQRYSSDNFYAFTRGNTTQSIFVALTNGGTGAPNINYLITYHPYENGTKLCNLFYPTTDCFVVQNGSFTIYLDNGECKIYYPV